MEIREVEAYLALAEEPHFGRAARRLDLTASRVTQLIQVLGRRVGGQLARRDGHGVSLTELGERLLAGARPAYARLERAMTTPALQCASSS